MITLRSVFAALLICRTAIVDARKHPPWFQTCSQTAHVLIALTAAFAETSAAAA